MKKFKKLFVAGTFDGLHVGHQYFLWKAAAMADELVVVIARDATILKVKNKKSQFSEALRGYWVYRQNIPNAHIRLGREDGDFMAKLREENPEAILLGYDQKFDEVRFKKEFPQIILLRAEAYQPSIFKSSLFQNR